MTGEGERPATVEPAASGTPSTSRRLTGSAPAGRLLLAIDTATRRAIVALGGLDGRPVAVDAWDAGHRHGEELLGHLEALLAAAEETEAKGEKSGAAATRDGRVPTGQAALRRVAAIVVGTGPGAFTGLRVGIATAKALAVGLEVPVVGISTAGALLAAAGEPGGAVLLPAGPSDRTLVTAAEAFLVPAGHAPPVRDGTVVVAVDLPGRAPEAALARGAIALDGLPAALLRLGTARLARGERDDPATLGPEYVTLPRGAARVAGPVTLHAGGGG